MEITLERLDEEKDRGIIIETREFGVARPEFIIGRAHDCDLQLAHDYVSRHHCELIIDDQSHEVRVRDLGSQNGTYVNDTCIRGDRQLKDGDKLLVGCVPFEVHIE